MKYVSVPSLKQFAPDGQAVLSQRAMLSGRAGSAVGDLKCLCLQRILRPSCERHLHGEVPYGSSRCTALRILELRGGKMRDFLYASCSL